MKIGQVCAAERGVTLHGVMVRPLLVFPSMRNVVLLGLFTSGCLGPQEPAIAAGEPSVEITEGTWFQGEPSTVRLSYPNATLCDEEDWSCVNNGDATMTVVSAICHGCTFVEDPTGKTGLGAVEAVAIANVDGPITIDAKLRFDATGSSAQVTGSVTGDHEVALVATCALVDSAVLSRTRYPVARDLRDCDSTRTRRATETVVVFPNLHTAHSGDFAGFCTSLDCGSSRQVTAMPAAAAWGAVEDRSYTPFIVMPALDATTTAISLSFPLSTGELSTLSLAVPPLASR